MIGDPSGRPSCDDASKEAIAQQEAIKAQLAHQDFSNDRAYWSIMPIDPSSTISTFRNWPPVSVNRMLTAECFRSRWNADFPFEFNHMLLQAYDFLVLTGSMVKLQWWR